MPGRREPLPPGTLLHCLERWWRGLLSGPWAPYGGGGWLGRGLSGRLSVQFSSVQGDHAPLALVLLMVTP